MLFILPEKIFWFLRYLKFYPDCFGHVWKWLDKKAKVNFKTTLIYWETNSYNRNITEYLKN